MTVGGIPVHRVPLMVRIPLMVLVVLASAGGCTPYDPPFQGDHAAQHYKDDLEKCRTSSRETVRLRNAATPGRWLISPITGPPVVRAAIRKCMQDKGYVLGRADD